MDNIDNKHNMAKSISLKDLEDCVRDIMFKDKKIVEDKHYVYDINGHSIEIIVKK